MILFLWFSGKGKTIAMDQLLPGLKMGEVLTTEGREGILGSDGNLLYHGRGGDYQTVCIYQHSQTYTG